MVCQKLFFVFLFASTSPVGHTEGLIANSSFLDTEMKIKLWGFSSREVNDVRGWEGKQNVVIEAAGLL